MPPPRPATSCNPPNSPASRSRGGTPPSGWSSTPRSSPATTAAFPAAYQLPSGCALLLGWGNSAWNWEAVDETASRAKANTAAQCQLQDPDLRVVPHHEAVGTRLPPIAADRDVATEKR